MRASRAILVLLVLSLPLRAQGPFIEVVPAGGTGCVGCNSGLLPPLAAPVLDGAPLLDGCGCGAGGQCVPGRKPCYPCESKTYVGRLLCGVYECVCCPDPCYEPKWTPLADAAFFVEAVRPVAQTRLRWDSVQNVLFPDRNEFLWPRADGRGRGPRPREGTLGERRLRYNDAVLITEGGTGSLSVIVETRYRSQEAELAGHASGFTDIVLGTKSLFFDCELLQISLLFKTYLPSGSFLKGLGTGHVSLEPGLLMGLKLAPTTYLQTQISQWIPLGGDPEFAGGILHTHCSLNHELCRLLPDVPIIGTVEHNAYWFQDGLYTDPLLGPHKSSGQSYQTLGGGVRLFVCDKFDFGFGAAFAITRASFGRETYRTEFRLRF